MILIGTGSEVSLCLEAYEQLTKEGVRARVVSMPSWELFDDQDKSYRESVLPPHVKARVSVEQASDFGWAKYTGSEGHNVCIETFGASAPLKQLLKKFGFNAENIVAAAKSQIARVANGLGDHGGFEMKQQLPNRQSPFEAPIF